MSQSRNHPEIEASSPPEEWDAAVADVLVPLAGNRAVEAIGAVSDLSDQEPLYAAAAATLATGAILRDGPTWRGGTRILAAHLLATAVRGVVKRAVDRTRPDAAAKRGEYVLREGRRHESDFNSFPSGHTAGAVAVAMAVGRAWPSGRAPALGLAGLAAGAQVLRSRHYLTDVVAGAAIGFLAEALIDRLIARAERV